MDRVNNEINDSEVEEFILDKVIEVRPSFNSTWKFKYNEHGKFRFEAIHEKILWIQFGEPWRFTPLGWNISPLFDIENIQGVELVVDSIPVSKVKRAAIGTLLFGGVGAVVGALSGIKAKPKSKVSVTIFLNNLDLAAVSIPCKSINDANRIIGTISNLDSLRLSSTPSSSNNTNKISDNEGGTEIKITDEIMKLKKMLDEGIIDHEEFREFKKKLMSK